MTFKIYNKKIVNPRISIVLSMFNGEIYIDGIAAGLYLTRELIDDWKLAHPQLQAEILHTIMKMIKEYLVIHNMIALTDDERQSAYYEMIKFIENN